ncbi:MAG TPA: ATP-binding protein, partial [Nitriliruptorales bacterium]
PATAAYVSAWAGGGFLAVALTLVGLGLPSPTLALVLMIGVTAIADLAEIELTTARTNTAFSLLEAGVAANLLVLPPAGALVATLVGASIGQLVRTPERRKLAFNLGQIGVAASLAAVLVAQFPPIAAGITLAGFGVVLLAVTAYTIANVVAMAGLIARKSGRAPWPAIRSNAQLLGATVGGNVMIGALAVSQWQADPRLIGLLVGPVAAVYLWSRGSVRTRDLLEHVREDRDRLEHIVSGATDGIAFVDEDGHLRVFNPAMQRITGRMASELTGASGRVELRDTEGRNLLAVAETDREPVEAVVLRPDGTDVTVRLSRAVLRTNEGDEAGLVVVVHDVSRQRELDTLREHFVSRVSHELRTPLAPIMGFAETLLRKGDRMSPERQRRALESISERAEHMTRLVDDLLQVTRWSRADDHGALALEPHDLRAVAIRAVEWAHEEAPDREFFLSAPERACVVDVDELRLRQTLTNLLRNAIAYAPANRPVDIAVASHAGGFEIRVADRGPGVPADKRETIFEPFQRLEDPLTMRTGGVGLGLHLARRFATAMGGGLTVAARHGGGAVFTLRLPASAAQDVQAA